MAEDIEVYPRSQAVANGDRTPLEPWPSGSKAAPDRFRVDRIDQDQNWSKPFLALLQIHQLLLPTF
jgi:hypothetical protein